MKFLIYILPIILSLLTVSCSHIPTPMPNGKGGVAMATQVGGKGQLQYLPDGSMIFIFDNEISLQHAFQAATALGLGYFEFLKLAEEMLTSRFLAGEITKREFNAGMLKLKELGIKAGVTGQGLEFGQPGFTFPQL